MKWGFMICVLSATTSFIELCEANVCVSYEDISNCSTTSKWAVNTPYLTATHDFKPPRAPSFSIIYKLNMGNSILTLCSIRFTSSGDCTLTGALCVNCSNAYSSTQKVLSTFTISPIDIAKDESLLQYDISSAFSFNNTIVELSVAGCPKTIGDAVAVTPDNPCGFNCTSQFVCSNNASVDDQEHQCTPVAEWEPPVSDNICTFPEPSTTIVNPTIFISSSSYNTSISANITGSPKRSSQEISAISITSIGAISMTFYGGTTGYALISKITAENVKFLHIGKGISVIAWSISVGVLFGIPDNNAAYIAGTTIGSLSLVGKAAVIYLLTSAIYNYKPEINSTPGKKENRTTTDRIDL